MIDVQSLFESEHEPSYPIYRSIEEIGIALHGLSNIFGSDFEEDPEIVTRMFFRLLVNFGGTAVDFDWIRGLGFCALEDWQYFEAAEAFA